MSEPEHQLLWDALQGAGESARLDALAAEVAADAASAAAADLRARKTLSDFRLSHDLEQADYLATCGYAFGGLAAARAVLRDLHARHGAAGKTVTLTEAEAAAVARFYEHVVRTRPRVSGPALNPANDWAAIEARYFAAAPEIVVIDNLLSPAALAELRAFCLASTIWRREYANQYFGTFSEDGFMTPLHLQIAAELQHKMPRLFGGQRLEQLWAFKYTARMGRGINVHADFARLNLNFWITPDEANLDPASGGMVIYDVPAPASWGFDEYNSSAALIADFLTQNRAGSQTIPHRCNRAVLFNSNLFHQTDAIRFKDGYENRRINVTYLFGERVQA
jgi:hypothetical protein